MLVNFALFQPNVNFLTVDFGTNPQYKIPSGVELFHVDRRMYRLRVAFRDVADGAKTRNLICDTHIFLTASL